MEDFRNRTYEATLTNGKKVMLSEYGSLAPTQHGDELRQSAFNPKTGDRPQFYEATVEWMRNEGIKYALPGENAELGTQSIRLFYFEKTKTWHASDALDIDHVKPWRDHLADKGVNNRADAAMAYNDIANLRMLPSVYNRARDSADAVFERHGENSRQWREWTQSRLSYDPSVDPPIFDPERDLARRTKATTGQPWTDQHTRADLSFDTRVLDKWFNHALKDAYAGMAEVENPKTHKMDKVPLFHCGASGQLTTRDALDIDHEIPFEIIVEKMKELYPKHTLTKADVLDIYNDTSNLRLVTRGANSSHEFERSVDGDWRDKVAPEKPSEFSGFMVDGPTLDDKASKLIKQHFSGRDDVAPSKPTQSSDAPVNMLIPRRPSDPDNLQPLPSSALESANAALTKPESPYHGIYGKVSGIVDKLSQDDPKFFASMKHFLNDTKPGPGHVENIATTLIAAAKEAHMTRIDAIVTNTQRTSLFAIQGNGHGDVVNRVEVPLRAALQFTVEENSARVSQVDRQTAQQTALTQQQGVSKHDMHQ
jgi:hypothetical protein